MGRPRLERPNYRLERNDFGIWTIYWTENRVPRSYSTRTRDETEARPLFDQWVAFREQPQLPSNPTVSAILTHYLADRKGHVSAYATLEYACKALKRHVGNLLPEQITKRMYWTKRKREGVSDGTIIREGVTLRAAFEVAVEDKLIPASVVPKISLPPSPPPRDRWLTREEVGKLLAGATTPHTRLFIQLGIGTAGRKEALEGLTWDRVDLERSRIELALPGRAQSKKRRAVVPINPELRIALEEAKKVAVSDHVIEWRGEPVGNIKKGFAAAAKRADIKRCTPHVLRHTAATWMVMNGVPIEEVARYLGDTVAVVERVYGKHSPDFLKRASLGLQATPSQTP